jgi:hypothetical protein
MTTVEPIAPPPATAAPLTQPTTVAATGPGGGEFARRVVIFLFAIVQGLIVLRIVFLLLDAREANALVSAVLNASQLFVAPFQGLLNSDALHAGGSVLDIAAIAALIGWTIVEAIVLAAIGIFQRRSA